MVLHYIYAHIYIHLSLYIYIYIYIYKHSIIYIYIYIYTHEHVACEPGGRGRVQGPVGGGRGACLPGPGYVCMQYINVYIYIYISM